jgi:hypothetical protein
MIVATDTPLTIGAVENPFSLYFKEVGYIEPQPLRVIREATFQEWKQEHTTEWTLRDLKLWSPQGFWFYEVESD